MITVAILTLVLACTAAAAYTDARSRRIPNAIPAVLLLLGLGLHAYMGWQSLAISIGIFLAVFAAGTFLFSFKLLGGGDVKLIAAAAAALGWPDSAAFLLFTVLAGGVLGVAMAAARGRLGPAIRNVKMLLFPMLSGVRPAPLTSSAGTMPYAIAIFAGAAALVLRHTLDSSLRI